jgi:hypothetical protein
MNVLSLQQGCKGEDYFALHMSLSEIYERMGSLLSLIDKVTGKESI